ncbi:hypothetical protein [Paenibacillus agricola]|nr:hypothetical protein [Paenibacillus agricola]
MKAFRLRIQAKLAPGVVRTGVPVADGMKKNIPKISEISRISNDKYILN